MQPASLHVGVWLSCSLPPSLSFWKLPFGSCLSDSSLLGPSASSAGTKYARPQNLTCKSLCFLFHIIPTSCLTVTLYHGWFPVQPLSWAIGTHVYLATRHLQISSTSRKHNDFKILKTEPRFPPTLQNQVLLLYSFLSIMVPTFT